MQRQRNVISIIKEHCKKIFLHADELFQDKEIFQYTYFLNKIIGSGMKGLKIF